MKINPPKACQVSFHKLKGPTKNKIKSNILSNSLDALLKYEILNQSVHKQPTLLYYSINSY